MISLHEAKAVAEAYSPAEERFNRRRRTVGLLLAPAAFAALWLFPLELAHPAHRLAAILGLVVVLWVTEAVPMPVAAIVGPILAIVLQIAPARTALAPFADPVIFLFMGSFILAQAMFVHGLDRRIAFAALSSPLVGSSAVRILVMYGAVTAILSMWMSNTATTAMMFPIGLSIVLHLMRSGADTPTRRYALVMMLMTSFAASIGGVATPVGTPPNLIGLGLLDRLLGLHVSFFHWVAIGLPVTLLLFVFLGVYLGLAGARGVRVPESSVAAVREESRRLGPMSRSQRNVLAAFSLTVVLWTAPGLLAIVGAQDSDLARAYAASVPEGVAAMIGAITLFVLPVDWRARRFTMTWDEAVRIDWGVVLLFGGGLSMGELAFSTGLAEAMGRGLTSWLPAQTPLALTVLFTAFAIVLSEATSNTASANMVVPIAIAVSQAAGIDPIQPALGAMLGASMGFMLPISTPPNAIVYSSGHVPLTAMIRYGIALDLAGFVVIVLVVAMLGPLLF